MITIHNSLLHFVISFIKLPDGHFYIAKPAIQISVSWVYFIDIYQIDKHVMEYCNRMSDLYNFKTSKRIFVLFCTILLKSMSGKNMLQIRLI